MSQDATPFVALSEARRLLAGRVEPFEFPQGSTPSEPWYSGRAEGVEGWEVDVGGGITDDGSLITGTGTGVDLPGPRISAARP